MLTSLFYYEHYKPYIMNTNAAGSNRSERRKPIIAPKVGEAPLEVALNKSLNNDVVSYAKNIYKNTTDLKYTAKKLTSDIRNYSKYKNRDEFDQDVFEGIFEDDLEQFTSSYNSSVNFLKNQQHSEHLGDVAEKLESMTEASKKILSVMGIIKNEDNALEVGNSQSTFWNGRNMQKKTDAAVNLLTKMYNETTGILNSPMSNHMNFKSLNYYYNYEVNAVHVDSFQIIKTGLLVNVAL